MVASLGLPDTNCGLQTEGYLELRWPYDWEIIWGFVKLQISAEYHNIFKTNPVTNKNAPHIKVVKKNIIPPPLDVALSLSA